MNIFNSIVKSISISACLFSICFAQNGISSAKYFFLKKNENKLSINEFRNESIEEIRVFEIDSNSIYATDGLIHTVIVDTSNKNLTLYSINDGYLFTIPVPYNVTPISTFIYNNNIFIGGGNKTEILLQYNTQVQKWYIPEIPDRLTQFGKRIEDFVLNDSILIAIDNIIIPKYLLFYKLNDHLPVKYINFHELLSNGAYESILEGRITKNYLALYSNTQSGYTGTSYHLTVLDLRNDMQSFAMSMEENDSTYFEILDYSLFHDHLLIAGNKKGLGILKIRPEFFKPREADDFLDPFNKRISYNELKFMVFENQQVIDIAIIPDTKKIILTLVNCDKSLQFYMLDTIDIL